MYETTFDGELKEIVKKPQVPSEMPVRIIPDESDIEALYAYGRQLVEHMYDNLAVPPIQGYIMATGKGHYFIPIMEGMLPVKMGQPKNRRGEDLF